MTSPETAKQIVYKKLKEVAKNQNRIYYSDLGDLINLDRNKIKDRNELFGLLGQISKEEHEQGRPLLSVIVVRKDTEMPGFGFMGYMVEIGACSGSLDKIEQKRFIFAEMKKVWAYWSKKQS